MPAHPIRQRLIPYRLLAYLLYVPESSVDWLESLSGDKVRIYTGPCSRSLRMKISSLREAIYWLLDQKLIAEVSPERKRGTLIIRLLPPTNVRYSNGKENNKHSHQ